MIDKNTTIEFDFQNEDGYIKEMTLHLISSKDDDYYTVWETTQYPLIRITQEDYHIFKTLDDIVELEGELTDHDKRIIAFKFNEFIDTFLNRQIQVDVIIKREDDDVAFGYGEIHYKTYTYSGDKLIEISSNQALMTNVNGYTRIQHSISKGINDRFIKIEKIKVGLKIPDFQNKDQEYFEDTVYYTDENNGLVRGISNKAKCPRVEISASFLRNTIENINFDDHIFIGTMKQNAL